eukprot:TRINITY_DN2727_c0_g1_i3.p1 TRINITY_DN2727_c0_g1~~TRINITY_DN2727_c0_g1_i3.p1  ORF type:complete len:326 (-),score=65.71 TRINITY_DN2727_c0_g1_i3:113-1090(-)
MSGSTFCLACGDSLVRVYDIRSYGPAKSNISPFSCFAPEHLTHGPTAAYVTGIDISKNGKEILATYSRDNIFLFDIDENRVVQSIGTPADDFDHELYYVDSESDLDVYLGDEDEDDGSVDGNDDEDGEMTGEVLDEGEEAEATREVERERVWEGIGEIQQETENVNTTEKNTPEIVPNDSPSQEKPYHRQRYSGHCNVRTVKGVSFFGPEDNYVCSGSDDGRIFIWDKLTARLVNIMKGDSAVVNVISGHPFDPVLATSGIDSDIKIWEPIGESPKPLDDQEDIMAKNQELMQSTNSRMVSIVFLRRLLRQRLAGDETNNMDIFF